MTQEQKELLLKDLCARLPYGVICKDTSINITGALSQIGLHYDMCVLDKDNGDSESCYILNCKPYLFPLESMTEEQRKEFIKFADYEPRLEDCGRHQELYYYDLVGHENNFYPNSDAIDWCNKNHFDYRGLIPMGSAINATGLNIYL